MQYIFACDGLDLLGGELLLEKIARQLILNQNKVRVCCKWISEEMQARFAKMQAEVIVVRNWKNVNIFFEGFDEKEEIRILTLLWEEFVRFSCIYNRKVKTLLYIVHPRTVLAAYNNGRIRKEIKKRIVRKMLLKKIQSGNVIFMDENTLECTKEYYKFTKEEISTIKIVRIAIDIEDIIDEYFYERAALNTFNILSVARADFPMKGYLLGLVDFFAQKCIIDSNITLTIISYGDDIEQLNKKIDEQPQFVKDKIMLIGKTDYDELKKYYKQAKLYVGMGTTILDAAQHGIPSIPVKTYTYELLADKFFMDDYTRIDVDKNFQGNNFENLYIRIRNYSYEEYISHSHLERDTAIRYYGTESTTMEIEQQFNEIGLNFLDLYTKVLYLMKKTKL